MVVKKIKQVFEVETAFNPCPECSSENLEIVHCGYSSFNVGHILCKDCSFKVEYQLVVWEDAKAYSKMAEDWNNYKRPPSLESEYFRGMDEVITLLRNMPTTSNYPAVNDVTSLINYLESRIKTIKAMERTKGEED